MPIDALSVSYVQLTRDLLAIAKFLFLVRNWFSLKNIIISGHLSILNYDWRAKVTISETKFISLIQYWLIQTVNVSYKIDMAWLKIILNIIP